MPSLSSSLLSSTSKTIGTTTAPNPHSVTTSSSNSTMVASSTLIPPSVDAKPSSSTTTTLLPRKNSNASSSGAFSEASRSFGPEENSTDSLFGLTSSSSSHYVIKCNLNTTTPTSTPSTATPTSPSITPPPVTLTPRVKVTVQQPSITNRSSSRFDSATDPVPSSSSSFLKTPKSNNLPLYSSSLMSTSIASSAPEFSISGASSIDESEELALYEHYLSISHARQSNPSPEMRKKTFDDWDKMQQRPLPRSRSEANTAPIEYSQQQQQQQTATSQIKTVSKFFLIYDILSDHCC